MNQSVLQAIRSYLEEDQRDWDLYLPEIECALRSSVHQATGVTPFFAIFGHNMFLNGSDYRIARKLRSLNDEKFEDIGRSDKLSIIRSEIKENLMKSYEKSSRYYNKRARTLRFLPGQEVFKRKFV